MMQSIPKGRVIKWGIATVMTPLAVGLFGANFYIASWYMRMATAGTPHQGPPPPAVIQRGVMMTASVGLWFTLLLWWFLHRKKSSFSALFMTRTERLWQDLGSGLLVGGLWVGLYGLIGWPPFSSMFLLSSAKLWSLPTSLSAGFCEEILFRGFLVVLIRRAGGGPKAQVIWSSLAFGLAHVFWGPVGMLFTVGLGASFAVLTLWRGNVWAAVAAHSLLNMCIEPGLMEKAMSFAIR